MGTQYNADFVDFRIPLTTEKTKRRFESIVISPNLRFVCGTRTDLEPNQPYNRRQDEGRVRCPDPVTFCGSWPGMSNDQIQRPSGKIRPNNERFNHLMPCHSEKMTEDLSDKEQLKGCLHGKVQNVDRSTVEEAVWAVWSALS
ncbi:hypothetical protein PoB_000205000 [Plakobranchus ocellatus]|uniref:Uncharacterized protein n=1 Tax=Plakobranchus ocellatus TaxID=259542 RepID=A0AAV3XXM3_9GAST|nr:hypothetical protein PoB_000205000 [Plakobranchus ocellatus]